MIIGDEEYTLSKDDYRAAVSKRLDLLKSFRLDEDAKCYKVYRVENYVHTYFINMG